MRVFLDTNVLVSAFATRGLSADVLRITMAEHELLLSEHVLTELARVLTTKFGVPEAEITEIEVLLRRFHVEPASAHPPVFDLRDEDDAWVLASAVSAGADVFVAGDRDVLDVSDTIKVIKIVSPRAFWNMIRNPS